MRILTRSTALLATCALLLLGGCSDDGGGDGDADPPATTAPDGDETTTTTDGGDSGDDDGGGDAQAFCDFLLEQEDLDMNEDDPEVIAAAMDQMRSLAPEAISDDVDAVLDVMEQLAELDEDDPDAMGAMFGLVMDPEFIAVSERIDQFGVDECDLEPGELMGSGDEGSATVTSMVGTPLDDDDPTGSDDGLSIDALQQYIDESYGDEPWADQLSSWSIMGETAVQVGPFEDDLSSEDALAACEVLAVKVLELEPDASLEILDAAGDPVVIWSSGSERCVPVL